MAISLTDRFCRGVAAHLRTRLIRVGPESIISFRKILDPGFTFSTQLRSKPGEPERSHPRQAKDTSQTSPNPKTAARIRVTAFLGSRHSSEKLAGADQESARLTLALPFSRRAVPPTKVTEFCSRMACLSTELRCQAGISWTTNTWVAPHATPCTLQREDTPDAPLGLPFSMPGARHVMPFAPHPTNRLIKCAEIFHSPIR